MRIHDALRRVISRQATVTALLLVRIGRIDGTLSGCRVSIINPCEVVMNLVTTSGIKRCLRSLLLPIIVLCMLACTQVAMAQSGMTLTISKSNDAPSPVPSGQVFTYTLTYSWTGGIGWSTSTPGTLIINDAVPSNLDVISAAPGSPISTIVGNNVTFTLNNITSPAGAGTVQINVRFKPGVTCPGDRACNSASIRAEGFEAFAESNRSCVTATAENKWQFRKDYISGCIVDSGDIVYRISIINPSGNDIGGLNLTNISLTDFLPPGAIITNVTPMNVGDWNGPYPSTGTVLLTGGPTSLNVQAGWAWYGCYITVRYPGGTFSAGQTVTNKAQLRFQTPCSQGQYLVMDAQASNTLCNPTPPVPGGSIWKWLTNTVYFPSNPWYTPSWAPGCCGTYYVQYYNSGSVTQSNIVVDDNLPPTVDVNSIYTYLPGTMTSVILDVYCNVGGVCQSTPAVSIPYTTSSTYTPSGLPGPICRIRWRYTGTLPPGGYTYSSINVCVRSNSMVPPYAPVVAGQSITNTVCASGTNVPAGLCANNTSVVTQTAPNILAAKFFVGKSGTCLPSCNPSTAGPFYPGDIIRWRMVVANVGSATATPCTITDVLPTNFSYVGNPTYYYGPIVWAAANNPTCCALSTTVPSVLGGLSSPAVGATTLNWNFATLPANCSGTVNYLVIEFDVKVGDNPTVPPGQYFNKFTFSAGNLPTPVTSNPAQVTINGYAQVQVFKDVRQNLTGATFGSSANVQPGAQAEYRLRITNTGILTLANIYLLDIMPHIGDITVLPPYSFRGSQYDLPISSAVTPVVGYTYGYNNSSNTKNPTRSTLFCSPTADPPSGMGVPPLTPASFVPGFLSTYSFQIVGNPATTIAPGGTQDFFFLATVPSGTKIGLNACNSFGLQVFPYGTSTCMKAESSPACVTVIPPEKDECDSIWGEVQLDECCTFTTSVLNSLGSIAQLSYNVLPIPGTSTPSGVVQSVQTWPCLPSSTIPGSLAGTTSGSLFFSPPCSSPLGVQVHASSTTASGEVCIELIAIIVKDDGTKVECRDTICFNCDPAPQDRCDSMSVLGMSTLNYSTRSFTIYNLKSPSSPICSVLISVTPHPGVGNLVGNNLFVDGVPYSWPYGSSAGYSQITTAHGLPASSTVQFSLNIPYGIGWTGTVKVTVIHCDGQKCEMDYGKWEVSKKGKIDVGTPIDVPDRATLHMHSLTFSRQRAEGLGIHSIQVQYNDPVTEVVAVTGASYPCGADDGEQGTCNDLFASVNVKDRSVVIDMRRDLDDPDNLNDPIVTVVYRAPDGGAVSAEIIYFDANGQEVGHDDVDFEGEDPPGRVIAGFDRHDRPDDREVIAGVLGALTARPNPTSGSCDLGFTLPTGAAVDLEILDALGNRVATVIRGEHLTAGEHHRSVDMSRMPTGVYMVALRVNGVPSVLRMELVK